VYVKDLTGMFVVGILLLTMLFLVGLFSLLYVLEAPIDNNGVEFLAGTPEYIEFYTVTAYVVGGLTLLLLALFLWFTFRKPRFVYTIGTDFDQSNYLYFENRSKAQWIEDDKMLTFYKRTKTTIPVLDPEAIRTRLTEVCFWQAIDRVEIQKIKVLPGKTKLRFKDHRRRFAPIHGITLLESPDGKWVGYREMIYTSYGGNTSVQSYKKYTFEDVNRTVNPVIPPEFKKEITQIR
jgi:hypothetical protein